MIEVAQFIEDEVDCDFLDINCGCPLDEVMLVLGRSCVYHVLKLLSSDFQLVLHALRYTGVVLDRV
eukprot:500107-Amphidinium_carterae.1